MRKYKIAYITHHDYTMYKQNLSLMKDLKNRGHELFAVMPAGEYSKKIFSEGIDVINYKITRGSIDPFVEIGTIMDLYEIMKKEQFDIVHTFTHKPNIYGVIAAKMAGVPVVVNTITGLGYAYTEQSIRSFFYKGILNTLYKIFSRYSDAFVFHNHDDMELFRSFTHRTRSVVIGGTGVDTEYFSKEQTGPEKVKSLRAEMSGGSDAVVITMIARFIRDKGISEFIDMADDLAGKGNGLIFVLVGWEDEGNPSAMAKGLQSRIKKSASIKLFHKSDKIRDIIAASDIYVLPSYREGLPMTVLEAMAMGKPVVTTDVPGCREAVKDGVNGLLVLAKNSAALSKAVLSLAVDPKQRMRMGNAGRDMAVSLFSLKVVEEKVIRLYNSLTGGNI